jgi:hypothetical protein
MKLTIMGDTHGEWGILNGWLNVQRPDILIVCGDFGYWPGIKEYSMKRIKNPVTDIYWCDGNHENHHALAAKLIKGEDEFIPNVFYMERGSVKDFPFLGTTLFLGGADSIDKEWRTPGHSWFPEEILTIKQVEDCGFEGIVDTIISHTSPEEFDIKLKGFDNKWKERKFTDPSRVALSLALEMYKPKNWYFGHWHTNQYGKYSPLSGGWSCEWMSLDRLGGHYKSWLNFNDGKNPVKV